MRLTLSNFGNHKATDFELPKSGVVLVLGKNGAGKSMLCEALCWCLWGGIVRAPQGGWSPVRRDTKVRIESGGAVYERVAANSTHSHLEVEGVKGRIREGTAKIIGRFGSLRAYQITRIFHRAALVRFSHATDSERKDLMEALLGTEKFGELLSAVHVEQHAVREKFVSLQRSAGLVRERLSFLQGKLEAEPPKVPESNSLFCEAARRFLDRTPEPEPEKSYSAERERMHVDVSEKLSAKRALHEAEENLARLQDLQKNVKVCPVCERPISADDPHMPAILAQASRRCDLAKEELAQREKRELIAVKRFGRLRELEELNNSVRTRRARALWVLEEHRKTLATLEASLQAYQMARDGILREYQEACTELARCTGQIQMLEARLARLEDLATIYGPRGARLTLLLDTFSEVARVATAVASSIYAKNLFVALDVGLEAQRVTLNVTLPDGVETSYRGLSEGERTLIDFSLLKALASVQSRPNTASATLPYIYDDILDAVDADNMERLAAYLQEEAKKSLLLVMSHDTTVRGFFPEAECLFVTEGKVRHG